MAVPRWRRSTADETPSDGRRDMDETPGTYYFAIDALTPDSLPMARLAKYLADLASLFGHNDHVHFDRVAPGSVVLVQHVDDDHRDRVRERLDAASVDGAVPADVADAVESLNKRLAKDNATGRLSDRSGADIIYFPGRDRPSTRTFGTVKQPCSFDGVLIRVGGTDDTVPVHLRAGEKIHYCNADRDMACLLAPHLFRGTLRVWGDGRWEREASGNWKLERFNISKFEELDNAPLGQVVARLREVEGSGWKQFDDPLAEIVRLRLDSQGD